MRIPMTRNRCRRISTRSFHACFDFRNITARLTVRFNNRARVLSIRVTVMIRTNHLDSGIGCARAMTLAPGWRNFGYQVIDCINEKKPSGSSLVHRSRIQEISSFVYSTAQYIREHELSEKRCAFQRLKFFHFPQ